jgi:hypothetical protein
MALWLAFRSHRSSPIDLVAILTIQSAFADVADLMDQQDGAENKEGEGREVGGDKPHLLEQLSPDQGVGLRE